MVVFTVTLPCWPVALGRIFSVYCILHSRPWSSTHTSAGSDCTCACSRSRSSCCLAAGLLRADLPYINGGALQEGERRARVVAGDLCEVAEVFARDLAQGRQVQLEPGLAGTGCSPRTRRYMLVPSMTTSTCWAPAFVVIWIFFEAKSATPAPLTVAAWPLVPLVMTVNASLAVLASLVLAEASVSASIGDRRPASEPGDPPLPAVPQAASRTPASSAIVVARSRE